MTDSTSGHTITIIRNAGAPNEHRREGVPAQLIDNRLVLYGPLPVNVQINKYDEIHSDYLNEPYVVTTIRSRKQSENQTTYELEITPLSIYRTTFVHAIKTAGKKEVPKDTILQVKLGDFPGTVNVTMQLPGQRGWSRFNNLSVHNHIVELPVKLIFLCHAKEDKEIVERIGDDLYQDGFLTWFDKKDLILGDDWEEKIEEAIEISDYVLVFLSNRSCSKVGYVQREMKYALRQRDLRPKGTRYIIPLIIENCEPPWEFRRIQWSYTAEDGWYEKLKRALTNNS